NRPAGEREVDVEEWDLVRAKVLRRAPIAIAADRDGRVDVVEEPRPLERVRQEVRGLDAWAEIRAEDHGVRIREFAAERRTDRGPVVEEADVGPVTRLRQEITVCARIPGRGPLVEHDPMTPGRERAAEPPVRRRVTVPPRTRDRQTEKDQFHAGASPERARSVPLCAEHTPCHQPPRATAPRRPPARRPAIRRQGVDHSTTAARPSTTTQIATASGTMPNRRSRR